MAVHMGLLVVLGLFGPCKINVYKKKSTCVIVSINVHDSLLQHVCFNVQRT